jgi:hypothetical protein
MGNSTWSASVRAAGGVRVDPGLDAQDDVPVGVHHPARQAEVTVVEIGQFVRRRD